MPRLSATATIEPPLTRRVADLETTLVRAPKAA
jgi:hypothetical protein